MKHEELTHKIIGCAYRVFNQLGFGFLESVCKKAMVHELEKEHFEVLAEKPLNVYYDNVLVGEFFADLFVQDSIIVELKSVQRLLKEHEAQIVNYLNAVKTDIGLLINFGPSGVETKRKYRESPKNKK
jgi:GxxExxY protein